MSTDIFESNHKLVLSLTNREGSSLDYKATINVATNTDENKVFDVAVSAEFLSKIKNFKLEYLAKHTNLKGFRPGKAPHNILWKQHQAELTDEILNDVVNSVAHKIVHELKRDLVVSPKFEMKKYDVNKELEFSLTLHLMPEFELPEEGKITVHKPKFEVTDGDIEDRVKTLLSQHKHYSKADNKHAAEDGDRVVIDFEGKIDGEVFAGGTAKNYTLELGSKSFIDTFETQLLKHKIGDELSVKVTFPENYHEAKYAGKPAEFSVKINEILKPTPMKDEEELATSLGFKSKEELHNRIKEVISKECDDKSTVKLKTELFDQLDSLTKFKVPSVLVDEEFAQLWRNVEAMIKNKDPEVNKPEKELKEEYTKLAERRVKLGLMLTKYAQKQNITIEQNDLVEAVRTQAMANPAAAQAIIKYYTENPKAVESLKGPILEDKAVKLMLSKVKLSEKDTKVKDLLSIAN